MGFRSVCRQVEHNLTAWNTRGEGVHSPYLFSLVRFVLRGNESFYAWHNLRPNRQEKVLFRLLNHLHQEGIERVWVRDERLANVVRAVANDIPVELTVREDMLKNIFKRMRVYIYMQNPAKNVAIVDGEAEVPADWTTVFDYGAMKMVFFDRQYLRRAYRLAL